MAYADGEHGVQRWHMLMVSTEYLLNDIQIIQFLQHMRRLGDQLLRFQDTFEGVHEVLLGLGTVGAESDYGLGLVEIMGMIRVSKGIGLGFGSVRRVNINPKFREGLGLHNETDGLGLPKVTERLGLPRVTLFASIRASRSSPSRNISAMLIIPMYERECERSTKRFAYRFRRGKPLSRQSKRSASARTSLTKNGVTKDLAITNL